MFRSAIFAVLAIALSSSPVQAQVTIATSLATSVEAAVAASMAPGRVEAATSAAPESNSVTRRPAPRWATTLAVAGPLADGLTTVYAIRQSGPNVRVSEGNNFYYKLFGADVKPGEIMAFKAGQAALMGAMVHYAGKQSKKMAIGASIVSAAVNFWVSSQNVRAGNMASRLNAGTR